jgi:FtsP/CotA-like multicopper oxidase with cupredoxin domain
LLVVIMNPNGASGTFMNKPLRDALHVVRLYSLVTLGALAVLIAVEWSSATAWAQSADKKTDLAIRPEFREPVVLTSKEGVLEIRLTARQGQATLDTVATPVQNFLLFDYEVIRGTASNGQRSGGNLYPAPTLRVFPGETLIVHFENELTGLNYPGLLHSSVHAQGSAYPALPGADDLVTDKSPHSWSSHQPKGECRQRHAAHPTRDVQYLHLRHP